MLVKQGRIGNKCDDFDRDQGRAASISGNYLAPDWPTIRLKLQFLSIQFAIIVQNSDFFVHQILTMPLWRSILSCSSTLITYQAARSNHTVNKTCNCVRSFIHNKHAQPCTCYRPLDTATLTMLSDVYPSLILVWQHGSQRRCSLPDLSKRASRQYPALVRAAKSSHKASSNAMRSTY
jgi:hypothetical protein